MHYQHTKPKIIIIPLSFSHVRISMRTRKSINSSRDSSKLIISVPIRLLNHTTARSPALIITTTTIKGLISTKSRTSRRSAPSAVAPRINTARADRACIISWWRVSANTRQLFTHQSCHFKLHQSRGKRARISKLFKFGMSLSLNICTIGQISDFAQHTLNDIWKMQNAMSNKWLLIAEIFSHLGSDR